MSDTSLDPKYFTGIEHLRGKNDFYDWKSQITNHFILYRLWDIVSGATPRPSSSSDPAVTPAVTTPAQDKWDYASAQCICILTKHVEKDIRNFISYYKTAPEMWRCLMDRYHRRDGPSVLNSFLTVSTFRYDETSATSIMDHVTAFEQHWTDLVSRTADAAPPVPGTDTSLEAVLHMLGSSQNSKMEFLFASFPQGCLPELFDFRMRITRELTYDELYRFLRELHEIREEEKRQEALRVDCTWCSARGLESAGHVWKDCGLLKQFKRGKGKRRRVE